ncbi:MAG TPA: hypothetical protein VKZ58_05210 [Longimicrobiales bacterium]|nr:hypothetical protein [Longimicrobiales bacterium]
MRSDAARIVGFTASCVAASAVGLPGMPEPRGQWLVLLAAFGLLGALLAVLTRSLPGTRRSRAVLLAGAVFGIMQLGTLVEYAVFSTAPPAEIVRRLASGLCATVLFLGLATWLFRGPAETAAVVAPPRFGVFGRAWRAVVATLAYVVLYLVVGAIAFQFTAPFYTDPAYGLDLQVPGLGAILITQFLRVPIFLCALWPLVGRLAMPRGRAALLGGAVLFLLGGLVPLLAVTEWPARLRIYHSIEIFLQNAPTGMLIAWLGTRRAEAALAGRSTSRVRTEAGAF